MTDWWKKYWDKGTVGMDCIQKTTLCPTVNMSHQHNYPYMWYFEID